MTRPIRTTRILSARQRRSKKRTLYAEQEGRCAQCGALRRSDHLILKHKIHRKLGGSSDLVNLYLVCHPCHRNGHRKEKRTS